MAGEAILIVDDNPQNLKLARVVLEKAGFEVRTAVDGQSALGALETFSPRLILMDVQMPGMDGLTVTRQLKASPAHRHVIIVALTANAIEGDDAEVYAAGCDGYITKPIEVQKLADTVARYIAAASP